jgi:hypothetical protein
MEVDLIYKNQKGIEYYKLNNTEHQLDKQFQCNNCFDYWENNNKFELRGITFESHTSCLWINEDSDFGHLMKCKDCGDWYGLNMTIMNKYPNLEIHIK